MTHYTHLSLSELQQLQAELQAEIAYCHSVHSPEDAAEPQRELHRVNDALAARTARHNLTATAAAD